jgi:hypothetical protein
VEVGCVYTVLQASNGAPAFLPDGLRFAQRRWSEGLGIYRKNPAVKTGVAANGIDG